MAKIGIYGGTFNPPHLGHVLAARAAKASLGLDQVLLIPMGSRRTKSCRKARLRRSSGWR